MEAALVEASEAGFHKTSLARIAIRAGVAIGNLNYHFGSRRELLRELMRALMLDLVTRLQEAVPDQGDFFERERSAMRVYLEYVRENPAYVQLADEIKLHEPELYRRSMAQWVSLYVKRIRGSVERGELRPMQEPEMAALAHLLLGARHLLHLMLQPVDGVAAHAGDERVVETYLDLVRGGLASR